MTDFIESIEKLPFSELHKLKEQTKALIDSMQAFYDLISNPWEPKSILLSEHLENVHKSLNQTIESDPFLQLTNENLDNLKCNYAAILEEIENRK